ncbi:MAG: tRNA lysidine(34) synthetase TilS [Clostridiales bacterium]|nr:tRNA lysidine(34) synthetase TilS [Clostridiales bacterium]
MGRLERAVAGALKADLPEGTRHVLVALSGGADSVALLHILRASSPQWGYELSAAHLNHNLRGEESLRDQCFVQDLCAAWGIPLTVESAEVARLAAERGQTVEEAGRAVRYALFARLCAQRPSAVTATGHTLSDQAETVLLNLIRGAGLDGLAGMPPARAGLIRPLLGCSRADVEDYCRRHGLRYVTDSTNLESIYARNHLRLAVMPLLEHHNPNILHTLGRQAALLREEADLLDGLADRLLSRIPDSGALVLDRAPLRGQPPALVRRALRRAVEARFGLVLSAVQSEALLRLALRPENGEVGSLPGGLSARTCYDRLILCEGPPPQPALAPAALQLGQNVLTGFGVLEVALEDFKLGTNHSHNVYTHRLNYGIIKRMPSVRGRLTGDVYRPAGRPEKSLKRMAVDARVPRELRGLLPVVVLEGEILSAFPFGPSARHAAGDDCRQVLRLTFRPAPQVQALLDR